MIAYIGLGINLALVLVHDKGTLQNIAQINFVASRTEVREWDSGFPDPDDPSRNLTRSYRVIPAIARVHELVCFQVVPRGVRTPVNIGAIEPSWKVYYGADQPSHPRRFFNWALKRATDYGAEVVAFLIDPASFAVGDLEGGFDFSERSWGRVVRAVVQKRLGSGRRQVLREDLATNTAYADLRARIDAEGMTRG